MCSKRGSTHLYWLHNWLSLSFPGYHRSHYWARLTLKGSYSASVARCLLPWIRMCLKDNKTVSCWITVYIRSKQTLFHSLLLKGHNVFSGCGVEFRSILASPFGWDRSKYNFACFADCQEFCDSNFCFSHLIQLLPPPPKSVQTYTTCAGTAAFYSTAMQKNEHTLSHLSHTPDPSSSNSGHG